jgi:hypothetical protein
MCWTLRCMHRSPEQPVPTGIQAAAPGGPITRRNLDFAPPDTAWQTTGAAARPARTGRGGGAGAATPHPGGPGRDTGPVSRRLENSIPPWVPSGG